MFDFFKKEDKTDEALIREACKRTGNMDLLKEPYFKEYMDLMMKGNLRDNYDDGRQRVKTYKIVEV